MSKDEVSRQIEEMQKYLKEQEELNKPAVIINSDDEIPLSEDYAEEVFEPEIVGGPADINQQNQPRNGKNGCGCGCFSFIIFIIFASIVISLAGSLFNMLAL